MKALVIYGSTASCKTKLAILLAKKINGEIINADSVGFYKKFDIGSAKPTNHEMLEIKHHLISVLEPTDQADAQWFCDRARVIINQINQKKKYAIVVGGSGLYIRALMMDRFHKLPSDPSLRSYLCQHNTKQLYELLLKKDPKRAAQIHPNDHFRLSRSCEVAILSNKSFDQLTMHSEHENNHTEKNHISKIKTSGKTDQGIKMFGIFPDKVTITNNITKRVDTMIKYGLIEETNFILNKYKNFDQIKPLKSIGYHQVKNFLLQNKDITDPDNILNLKLEIVTATKKLAKKQRKWFKQGKFVAIYDQDLSNDNKYIDYVCDDIVLKLK